jgi:thioredoxin-dependent peroxiredoxin
MSWPMMILGVSHKWWRLIRKPRFVPPREGDAAPDFSLPDQHGKCHSLKDFSGSWLVLYFYPRDDTPGCTREACGFRDDLQRLESLGAHVAGVSVDDSPSHAAFAVKHELPFPLLADRSAGMMARYGAVSNLLLFKVAKRYTFLIDPQGTIRKVYSRVRTAHHSREIIEDLEDMTARTGRPHRG